MKMDRTSAINTLASSDLKTLTVNQRENLLVSSWWCLDADDPEFNVLPELMRLSIQNDPMPADPGSAIYDAMLIISLSEKYVGVKNNYLAQRVSQLKNAAVTVEGEEEDLRPCPCCGFKTLERRGEYDICPVCFWEDMGVWLPEQYSGPNHMTLAEGRANYIKMGACSEKDLLHVDKAGPEKHYKSVAKTS